MNTSRWLVLAVQLLFTVTVVSTQTSSVENHEDSNTKCTLDKTCSLLILPLNSSAGNQCSYISGVCDSKALDKLGKQIRKQEDEPSDVIFLRELQLYFKCGSFAESVKGSDLMCMFVNNAPKEKSFKAEITFKDGKEKALGCIQAKVDFNTGKVETEQSCPTRITSTTTVEGDRSLLKAESRCDECVITGSHVAIAAIACFVGGAFVMLLFLLLLRRRSNASLCTCLSKTTELNETARREKTEGYSNQAIKAMDGPVSIAVSQPGYDDRKLYSHLRQGKRDSEHAYDQSQPAYETLSKTANKSHVSSEEHFYNTAENSYQTLKDQEAVSNGQENGEHAYTGLKGQSEIQTTGVSGPRSESVNHLQDKAGNVFENRESVASEHNYFTLQNNNFRLSEPRETAAISDSQNGPHSYLQNENAARTGSGDKRENTEEVQQKDDPHPYFTLQKVDAAGPGNDEKGEKNEEEQKGGEAAHDYFVLEESMSGDKKNDAHGQL